MRFLVPLPILLPLGAAAVSMGFYRRVRIQRFLGVATLTATVAVAIALLVQVEADGISAVHVGGWPAPLGITLVADLFSALVLVVSMIVVLAVLLFAVGHGGTRDQSLFFHPLYLVLTAGVSASFLTGDLFNLFVAFEITLSASYVLITLGGNREQVRTGMTYVVINLLASTLFITGIALVYAATGTVNMADLAVKFGDLSSGVRTALGLMLFVAFGIKAAVFPLFFWLPDAYPTAPTPVTAIFAGLLTKVGIYVIIRTETLVFSAGEGPSTVLLTVAGLTMIVGVLGAIAQDDMKRILSFHIVSQIGYMLMGVGLLTVNGVAGAVFFILHHIPVKTALFLVTGMIEARTGTAALRRLGGMMHRAPAVAVIFAVAALSLAGLPPFSGFIGKLALVEAGLEADRNLVVAVSLVVSLLTLFSMTKIWAGVFWGAPDEPPPRAEALVEPKLAVSPLMLGPAFVVVGFTVFSAVVARPLFDLCTRAATTLVDPAPYVAAVLG